MKMELRHMKEMEDGSVICELELDDDAKRYLIEKGFIKILQIALDKDPAWWTEADEMKLDIITSFGEEV
jgi:hypothetical protein